MHDEPQPPTEIVRRLRQVHAALGLKFYHPAAGFSSWAVTWTWAANDPRRERIQRGEIRPDADFDIIAWLPLDCPVAEAAAYVERAVKHYPREDIQNLTNRLHHYNAVEAPAENWREVEAAVMTRAEDLGKAATPRAAVAVELRESEQATPAPPQPAAAPEKPAAAAKPNARKK